MGRAAAVAGREGSHALRRDYTPRSSDFNTQAVWAAGEILQLRQLQHLRHDQGSHQAGRAHLPPLLRLILLTEEFEQLTPPGIEPEEWKGELKEIADKLTEICRAVDPTSTEETIKKAHAADVVEGEEHAKAVADRGATAATRGSRRGERLRCGDRRLRRAPSRESSETSTRTSACTSTLAIQ